MKRTVTLALAIALLISMLSGCSKSSSDTQDGESERLNYDTVCAVWISCYELGQLFASSDEDEAKESLKSSLSELSEFGINTLFVHTRAFSDAIYDSELFPRSVYLPKGSTYDALELLLDVAHSLKLSVHAWINPYRVSSSSSIEKLDDDTTAKKWYNSGHKERLIVCSSGIYYNPADVTAQRLIISGVREICENYEVDGIHFDDYFYPNTSESVDKASYDSYIANSGQLSLTNFRRQNVSALVQGVYDCIKSINGNILFGISPQASISNNENIQYADIKSWCKYSGFADYICPQIYFGFLNETSPFEKSLSQWSGLERDDSVKLIAGLALYKSGTKDNFASSDTESSDSPYFEWKNYTDIIARQVQKVKEDEQFSGFALYSYSYLLNDGTNKCLSAETENLKVEMSK